MDANALQQHLQQFAKRCTDTRSALAHAAAHGSIADAARLATDAVLLDLEPAVAAAKQSLLRRCEVATPALLTALAAVLPCNSAAAVMAQFADTGLPQHVSGVEELLQRSTFVSRPFLLSREDLEAAAGQAAARLCRILPSDTAANNQPEAGTAPASLLDSPLQRVLTAADEASLLRMQPLAISALQALQVLCNWQLAAADWSSLYATVSWDYFGIAAVRHPLPALLLLHPILGCSICALGVGLTAPWSAFAGVLGHAHCWTVTLRPNHKPGPNPDPASPPTEQKPSRGCPWIASHWADAAQARCATERPHTAQHHGQESIRHWGACICF